MRQLTVTAPHALEWSEVPAPQLRGTEAAIVRPVAVATCDFDHLIVSGRARLPLPLAIGHEFAAEVVEVGDDVRSVEAGDLVAVSFQVSCGRCDACRRGHTSSCERVPWLSCYGLGEFAGDWGGAASDLVGVPYADAMLVVLPDGVSPVDAAAASCNIPDAYRCVGPHLADRPGAPVLVVGGAFGNIALYTVGIARALGASRVDYLDRDAERASRAAALGANVIPAAGDVEPGGYPITVDASQDPNLLALALRATGDSGVCTASTMYLDDAPLPLLEMFQRCVTFRTGQPHARTYLEPVLDLITGGSLRPAELADAVVAWDEAPLAFASGAGKAICVRPHSAPTPPQPGGDHVSA